MSANDNQKEDWNGADELAPVVESEWSASAVSAVRVAAYYLGFGLVWILLSDRIAEALSPDPEALSRAQSVKGWLFVILSAVLIYLLVRGEQRRRRRVTDELAFVRRRVGDLINRLPGMFCRRRHEEGWPLEYVSAGAREVTGYRRSTLMQRGRFETLVHPEDRDSVFDSLEEAVETDTAFAVSYRIWTAGSEEKWVWEQGRAVDGRLIESLIFEITRWKQLEEQWLHARKLDAVGQFAAQLARDFKNALTVIHGYAELALNRRPGDERIRDDLEKLHEATDGAVELARKVLAFSRREKIRPTTVDCGDLLERMHGMLDDLMGENVEVVVERADEIWPVYADSSQLEEVLLSLAANAHEAMPEGGRFTVEVANTVHDPGRSETPEYVDPGAYVRISVADTGVGMVESVRERAFEPHFTTNPNEERTGLGLAAVLGIVEQNGGHVHLDSELGEGTEVTIYLPRHAAKERRISTSSSPP